MKVSFVFLIKSEDFLSRDLIQLLRHLASLPLHKQFKPMELPGCTFGTISPSFLCWGHYWLVVTWWLGAFEDDYPVLPGCTPHSGFIHCFLKTRCSFCFWQEGDRGNTVSDNMSFLWCHLRGSSWPNWSPCGWGLNLAGKDRIRARLDINIALILISWFGHHAMVTYENSLIFRKPTLKERTRTIKNRGKMLSLENMGEDI